MQIDILEEALNTNDVNKQMVLSNHPDEKIRRKLATNTLLCLEAQKILVADHDLAVKERLAYNENLDYDIQLELYEYIKNRPSKTDPQEAILSGIIHKQFLRNKNLSPKIVESLIELYFDYFNHLRKLGGVCELFAAKYSREEIFNDLKQVKFNNPETQKLVEITFITGLNKE